MKIHDTSNGVRVFVRSPLHTILAIAVYSGERVWEAVHSGLQPVKEPIFSVHPATGESVQGIVMTVERVTVTPEAQLCPDAENTPDEQYATRFLIGESPNGYRQVFPAGGASPQLRPGCRYAVSVSSTEGIERAVFTKG